MTENVTITWVLDPYDPAISDGHSRLLDIVQLISSQVSYNNVTMYTGLTKDGFEDEAFSLAEQITYIPVILPWSSDTFHASDILKALIESYFKVDIDFVTTTPSTDTSSFRDDTSRFKLSILSNDSFNRDILPLIGDIGSFNTNSSRDQEEELVRRDMVNGSLDMVNGSLDPFTNGAVSRKTSRNVFNTSNLNIDSSTNSRMNTTVPIGTEGYISVEDRVLIDSSINDRFVSIPYLKNTHQLFASKSKVQRWINEVNPERYMNGFILLGRRLTIPIDFQGAIQVGDVFLINDSNVVGNSSININDNDLAFLLSVEGDKPVPIYNNDLLPLTDKYDTLMGYFPDTLDVGYSIDDFSKHSSALQTTNLALQDSTDEVQISVMLDTSISRLIVMAGLGKEYYKIDPKLSEYVALSPNMRYIVVPIRGNVDIKKIIEGLQGTSEMRRAIDINNAIITRKWLKVIKNIDSAIIFDNDIPFIVSLNDTVGILSLYPELDSVKMVSELESALDSSYELMYWPTDINEIMYGPM